MSDHHVRWSSHQWWTSLSWSYLLYDSRSTFQSLVFRGHVYTKGSSHNATAVLRKIRCIKINITCNQNMWHDMAIIILCFWSPSRKHRHDLHCHRLDTLISIIASLSSRQLLLLQLLLMHSDKVKQLHGVCISYNKETTIRLLSFAYKLQNMIISYNNVYHIMSWPYHITTCPAKTS